MPFIKDLGQLKPDFSIDSVEGKERPKKKEFMKVRLPLSITGDKMPKMGDVVVAVIVGSIKGFENSEHRKEVTVEAKSGGIYMKASGNLEAQIASAFGKKEHNSDHKET